MTIRHDISMIAVAVLLTASSSHLFGKPRQPAPPFPETFLQQWTFDEAYFATVGTNASTVAIDTSVWAESWSGYALARSGQSVNPFSVSMATTNRWSVAPEEGSIRFWYVPGWTSGSGPGHKATLLDLSLVLGTESASVWSLYATADGNTLNLDTQGDTGAENLLHATIAWTANQWHLVTVSYSKSETLLYVDDALVATGAALPAISASVLSTTGHLTVGSSVDGSCSAEGEFDDLTTFSQELKETDLGFYYFFMRSMVDLGPITTEEVAFRKVAKMRLLSGATPTTLEAESKLDYDGLFLQIPNVFGTNISLSIGKGATNQSYDILYAPSVFDGMASSDWTVAAFGVYGQTNFTVPIQGNIGFYRVQIVNGVQVWQLADPSNTNSGFLTITIDNPTNGSTVH